MSDMIPYFASISILRRSVLDHGEAAGISEARGASVHSEFDPSVSYEP